PQSLSTRRLRTSAEIRGHGRASSCRLHALRIVRVRLSVEHSAVTAFPGKEARIASHEGGRMSVDKLIVTASPHIRRADSTPRIMWNVVGSLVPVVMTATFFFGVSALM